MKGVRSAKKENMYAKPDNETSPSKGKYSIIHNLQNIYVQNTTVDPSLLSSIFNLHSSSNEKRRETAHHSTPQIIPKEKQSYNQLSKMYLELQQKFIEQSETIKRIEKEKEAEFQHFQLILSEAKRLERKRCETCQSSSQEKIQEPIQEIQKEPTIRPSFAQKMINSQRKRSETQILASRPSLLKTKTKPVEEAVYEIEEKFPEFLSSSEKAFISKLDDVSREKVVEMIHRQKSHRLTSRFDPDVSKVKKLEISLKEREKLLNEKHMYLLKLEGKCNRKGKERRSMGDLEDFLLKF